MSIIYTTAPRAGGRAATMTPAASAAGGVLSDRGDAIMCSICPLNVHIYLAKGCGNAIF